MRSILSICIVFLLAGCTSQPIYEVFPYSSKEPSRKAKIFLVSFDDESASFQENIVDQRKIWLDRGVRPEEISCYFSAASLKGWQKDGEKFFKLKDELSSCYIADVGLLKKHILEAAISRPDFFYLYFSGHGVNPFGEKAAAYVKKYPYYKKFHLPMRESLRHGTLDWENFEKVMEKETEIEGIALTAKNLSEMLSTLPRSTRKLVVIDSCYAAGIFAPWQDGEKTREILKEVANVTSLSASASNRMGVGRVNNLVEFGSLFERALAEGIASQPGKRPERLDWKSVFTAAKEKIRSDEDRYRFRTYMETFPVYLSNLKSAE